MIKSLSSDYNKRFLKILNIKKLRDVKNGSEYISKKGIQSTIILKKKKKVRIYKNTSPYMCVTNEHVYMGLQKVVI